MSDVTVPEQDTTPLAEPIPLAGAAPVTMPAPLVEACNITKYFPVRASPMAKLLAGRKDQMVKAVDGVNLRIWPRETVGLVGESGCGKTTLGRVITRLHPPTSGQIYFRNRLVAGNGVVGASAGEDAATRRASQMVFDESAQLVHEHDRDKPFRFFRVTQIIFQNPYSSLNPRKTVREIIGVALQQRGITDPVEKEAETLQLLKRVGLSERHIHAYPHQFSGGQRQRIGIARALAVRPEFIVADEPVSALDVSIQAQVINLLEELQDEFNLTYLFIAHDLSVIHYLSDRVAVMYLGHIVEEAKTQSLFDNPRHPYTQALLAAIPRVSKVARRERIILEGTVPSPIDPPPGCPFHTRCFAKKGPECEQELPPEVEVDGHRVACWLYV
jgi:oligopeptide/dipeptide ABC transporter ATP-binding protein